MPTAAIPPAITVTNLGKTFAGPEGQPLHVLQDISFTIAPGEVAALLGPSGCGKSTLLNIIAGLQPATTGATTVDFRRLGYVFQEDRLLPWRTALRNVAFSLEAGPMRRPERDARARRALGLMALEPFAQSYPHQLSGGMRSRVALARSLVLDPAILLMDEPFGRLDAQTRAQMHAELLRVHALLGMSILFVTHDVDEAVTLADRVILLAPRPGRIQSITDIAAARPRDTAAPALARHVQALKRQIGED